VRTTLTGFRLANLCAESYNARMAQMNISIPDKLKGWAEARVAEGRYASTSDYVRDLVRRDQEHEEKLRRLQAAIDEGLASGVSERDPFEHLDELRKQLRASGDADAV
jgi:antitoxin ParD1/3/4